VPNLVYIFYLIPSPNIQCICKQKAVSYLGSNPTTVSSNATSSLVRFEIIVFSSALKNLSMLLQDWRCLRKFRSLRIGLEYESSYPGKKLPTQVRSFLPRYELPTQPRYELNTQVWTYYPTQEWTYYPTQEWTYYPTQEWTSYPTQEWTSYPGMNLLPNNTGINFLPRYELSTQPRYELTTQVWTYYPGMNLLPNPGKDFLPRY
jgi:hypothetical protein